MKFIYRILLIALLGVSVSGCESFVGGDINADPNNPVTVPVTAQLPAFQLMLSGVYGGDFSAFSCMLAQQVEGVARQWSSFNQYTGLTPNRFDAAWNSIYENILNETKVARASAIENGLNHHKAIIDLTEAFALIIAADVWDDIPYSQALQGIDELNPAYDPQSDIYSTAIGFIDGAISLLNGPVGNITPGGEDVFYGGDASAWIKAATGLKARALLHQGDYTQAQSLAASSLESAADNWNYFYPDQNSAGPWFRFNRDREGDIEFHPQMRAMMEGFNDSNRLALFDQIFNPANTYLSPDWEQELLTYREMQFIVAECALRNGDNATAHAAFLNGIKGSFDFLGVDGYDDYVAQESVNPGADGLTLEHVITQKYISLFLDFEIYNDFRRTGIPSLTPVSGSSVPVRWDYPAIEYLFNSSSPAEGSVNIATDRVGWNR